MVATCATRPDVAAASAVARVELDRHDESEAVHADSFSNANIYQTASARIINSHTNAISNYNGYITLKWNIISNLFVLLLLFYYV